MISHRSLLILLLSLSLSLTLPGQRARQSKGDSSYTCSREKCQQGRTNMKMSSDCVRAPFCVRQFVRDLKKLAREKVRVTINKYYPLCDL